MDGGCEAADKAVFVPFTRKDNKIKSFRVAVDVNIIRRLFTSAASCWVARVDTYDRNQEKMWELPQRQDPSVVRWSSMEIWTTTQTDAAAQLHTPQKPAKGRNTIAKTAPTIAYHPSQDPINTRQPRPPLQNIQQQRTCLKQ